MKNLWTKQEEDDFSNLLYLSNFLENKDCMHAYADLYLKLRKYYHQKYIIIEYAAGVPCDLIEYGQFEQYCRKKNDYFVFRTLDENYRLGSGCDMGFTELPIPVK